MELFRVSQMGERFHIPSLFSAFIAKFTILLSCVNILNYQLFSTSFGWLLQEIIFSLSSYIRKRQVSIDLNRLRMYARYRIPQCLTFQDYISEPYLFPLFMPIRRGHGWTKHWSSLKNPIWNTEAYGKLTTHIFPPFITSIMPYS